MTDQEFSEWLKTTPPIVAKLENEAEYIPIAVLENDFEVADSNWSTTDFKFNLHKVGNGILVEGSVMLHVRNISRPGAASFYINPEGLNQNYSATALSLATSNAAKRFGKRWGRELNGRLDLGETADVFKTVVSIPESPERIAFRAKLAKCKNVSELSVYNKSKGIRDIYNERLKELTTK